MYSVKTLIFLCLPLVVFAAPLVPRGLFKLYSIIELNKILAACAIKSGQLLKAHDGNMNDMLNDFHGQLSLIYRPPSGCIFCNYGASPTNHYDDLCSHLICILKNCIEFIACGLAAKKAFLCKTAFTLLICCCKTIIFVLEPLCYIFPSLGGLIGAKIRLIKTLMNELICKIMYL